ncbi:hypothetical protein H0W32_02335 [Patescibacteria group bacterium]|nr:hypothetical protein [Patescibacteria group bacterium]
MSFESATTLEEAPGVPESYTVGFEKAVEDAYMNAFIKDDQQEAVDDIVNLEPPSLEDIAKLDEPEQISNDTNHKSTLSKPKSMRRTGLLVSAAATLFGMGTGCAAPHITVVNVNSHGAENTYNSIISGVRQHNEYVRQNARSRYESTYSINRTSSVQIGATPNGVRGRIYQNEQIRATGRAAEQQQNQDEARDKKNKR